MYLYYIVTITRIYNFFRLDSYFKQQKFILNIQKCICIYFNTYKFLDLLEIKYNYILYE